MRQKISLTICKHPGIRLRIRLEGKMKLISCLYIPGSASEPVFVIAIHQGLRVNEPMKIIAWAEHLAWNDFIQIEHWNVQQRGSGRGHGFISTIYLCFCPALHVHTIVTQIAWYCKQCMKTLLKLLEQLNSPLICWKLDALCPNYISGFFFFIFSEWTFTICVFVSWLIIKKKGGGGGANKKNKINKLPKNK